MDVTNQQQRSELARRVRLAVTIGGQDVTGAINPYLISATYTDNAAGKADEVRLELHDRDAVWLEAKALKKGLPVTMSIRCEDWLGPGKHLSLNCGAFKIDEVEHSGPPDKVSIKAVSAALTDELRETPRTQAWEDYSLQAVASEIAGRNGLELLYNADPYPFGRQDQREESDLPFLQRLASARGVNVKVHDGKLVCEAASRGDARTPHITVNRTGDMFSPERYTLKDQSQDTAYSGCDVQYWDAEKGEMVTYSFGDPGKDGERRKVTLINRRVESRAEAETFAKSGLRDKNEKEGAGSIDIMGHPGLVSGSTIILAGFGRFDGTYFVEKATHKISGKYTTSAELRRTLGY
uniref:phage late control D family protein n=1 Tax=uncultured Bilophila sp. TaxID=529385 RepID=UPI0025DCBDAE|nr:contractile injection system protein, VgrG/Pvc8 family [uncultured Bilophila sp.]